MALRIVNSGEEPILKEALAYLERRGIPASHIRAIQTEAEVGQPMMITVSLFVQTEEPAPPEKLSGVCEPLDAADTGDAELAAVWKYRCDECDRSWPTAVARDEYHGMLEDSGMVAHHQTLL